MNARDELARLIQTEYVRAIDRKRPQDCWDAPADAIVAAGYRKPRTITTEEELEALHEGSVLLAGRHIYRKAEGALLDPEIGLLSYPQIISEEGSLLLVHEPEATA